MKALFLSAAISLLFTACTPQMNTPQSNQNDRIKILIIDGFSNHDWEATTQMLLSVLAKDEDLEVNVSTVPDQDTEEWASWLPSYEDYQVVIQNTNDINSDRAWPAPARIAFENYMKSGGAMLVFHSANNAFPEWPEYNKMIGLGWRGKDFGPAIKIENGKPVIIPAGQGENTGHGKRVDALITRLGEHPIHEGLPAQWLAADLEIYRYARGPAENMQILSYAKDAKTGLDFPIEWTVQYGEGRIYNSTYGHYWRNEVTPPPSVRCVAFQTLFRRAIRWLAKQEIETEVPEKFPSEKSISLY